MSKIILKENSKMPDIRPGDIIRVYQKIKEGNKEREQAFEGVVIKRSHGLEPGASFIVRKISQGIGVERKFSIHSPLLTKIQIKKRSHVKRGDLSYLRNIRQMAKKLKDRKVDPIESVLVVDDKQEQEVAKQKEESVEEAIQQEEEKKKLEEKKEKIPQEETKELEKQEKPKEEQKENDREKAKE